MKGVRKLIEKFLEEDPRCREDDKWLTYKVFQAIAEENGEKIFLPFNLFNKFPAFETIKRTRATIQNKEKRFLPDGEEGKVIGHIEDFKLKEVILVIPESKWRNSQYH